MVKIVMDFDEIDRIADKIEKAADDDITLIKNSNKQVTSNLSNWEGNASSASISVNEETENNLIAANEAKKAYAGYLRRANTKVQDLESSLSNLKI